MSDKDSEQRRDNLLLRLLHTPPEARADRKKPRAKPEGEVTRTDISVSRDEKRTPSD